MPCPVSTESTIWYQAETSLKTWVVVNWVVVLPLSKILTSILSESNTKFPLLLSSVWKPIIAFVPPKALLLTQTDKVHLSLSVGVPFVAFK